VLVVGGRIERAAEANLPVGLIPVAEFTSAKRRLSRGDKLILVTDGVTEAEDCNAEMFGNERLESAALSPSPFEKIFEEVRSFCGSVALGDDCTVLEVTYRG
jgi:serine phosphatase RsbU (regulator of sigma subunit)